VLPLEETVQRSFTGVLEGENQKLQLAGILGKKTQRRREKRRKKEKKQDTSHCQGRGTEKGRRK